MREQSVNKPNLDKLLEEGKKNRRSHAKAADYSVVLPQSIFRNRWTEPINRVKVAEALRLKEAEKQPKKVRHSLSGINQWREVTKGSIYLKRLFVEGEIEKERRFSKFEERRNSFAEVKDASRREKPEGALTIDLSASAKHSWRGEVDDPKVYWSMLYEEGVKNRESKTGKYLELVKAASKHLPGCLDLTKNKNKTSNALATSGGDNGA